MSRKKEPPGNTLASQRSYELSMLKSGQALARVDAHIDAYAEEDVFIMGMSIRVPQDIGLDVFITVRAMKDGAAVVAFHSGATFAEALLGVAARFQNRSLRWKEDQYG